MKCLVTGGAGFIGSHLCERLLEDGHQVQAIDNLSVGRLDNLKRILGHEKFTFEKVDIAKKRDWLGQYFYGVDWVFHLAARADIVPSIVDPCEYHRSNVEGTLAVLECAKIHKVKKLVYAASSSCYGLPDGFPTPEWAEARPEYPYALTKYVGEQYVMHWSKVYGLPAVSLRLFNVYGPRARTSGTYGAVFGVFLAQLFHGAPLTVVGDGSQTRDFTFISDVVEAFVMAAEGRVTGEIMNVGSGDTYSVNRLVELLGATKIEFIPKRPGEPDCTFADTTKIRQLLGWQPKVSFEKGVKIMLEHLEDFRDAPTWTSAKIKDATKVWFECLGKSQ